MTTASAISEVVFGCALLFIGFANQRFYWMKGLSSGNKEAPKWVGRLLFVVIGAVLVLLGMRFFLLGY